MDNESLTSGLDPDKLGELLNVCSDKNAAESEIDPDQKKAELLLDRLAETLPFDLYRNRFCSASVIHLSQIDGLLTGESIKNLLNNAQTDIALIKNIKDYSKKLSKSPGSEAERDTANIIYYAAIAHALVFHDKRITKFSYKNLAQYFSVLSKKSWIPANVRALFVKAQQHCHDRTVSWT